MLKTLFTTALLSLSLLMSHAASASTDPLTIIVGYSAGGASDVAVRRIAQALTHATQREVIVENHPGGSGVIAMNRLMRAKSDGNTVLLAEPRILYTNWTTLESIPYKHEDFVLSGVFMKAIFLLVAKGEESSSFSVDSIKDASHQLNFATAGINSPHHTLMTQIEQSLEVTFNHIPLKGDALSIIELAAGRVDLGIVGPVNVIPYLEEKKVIPLSVFWDVRLPFGPFAHLPTIDEFGIPEVVNETEMAWAFPKGTDEDIIDAFSEEVNRLLSEVAMQEDLMKVGFIPYVLEKDVLRDKVKEAAK